MPYEELRRQGRIQEHPANSREIRRLLGLAARDLRVADANLAIDPDWAYTMAYNAVLQASRAFMFSQGYRPRETEGHATVVRFMREAMGTEHAARVAQLDQMRRKRHRTLYETAGLVGDQEAMRSLAFAKEFVELLSLRIKR